MKKCECGLDPQRVKEAFESKEKAIDEFIFAQQQDRKLLTKYREAIKVAMEALTNASLYADKDDVNGLAGGIAKEAKQKIEEILK